MNQILSVESKKKKSKGNGAPVEIKKIVRFFCVVILLFGIGMVGKGSYAILKEMNIGSTGNNAKAPVIDIEKEQDNNLTITVAHSKEITKMTYNWNGKEDTTVNGEGTTTLQTKIALPIGNNTLHLKVYDIEGNVTPYEKEYLTDAEKPQIAFELIGNKLKITAKDTISLSYITYRWDEGEETKVEPKEDSKAQIELEVDIPKGEHTVTVIAVNTNNITETKSQQVKGVTKPKADLVVDGKYIVITGTDEQAVKEISYTLNGQKYKIDYSSYNEKTVIWKQEMTPGENRITGAIINFDGAEQTFDGVATYNP